MTYLQDSIQTRNLTEAQRARLIYIVLLGNLDLISEPLEESGLGNMLWKHVGDLLRQLRFEGPQKTKTRLRNLLSAQYSFGVTVGAPVIFFGASFVYALVEKYANHGNEDISNALGGNLEY